MALLVALLLAFSCRPTVPESRSRLNNALLAHHQAVFDLMAQAWAKHVTVDFVIEHVFVIEQRDVGERVARRLKQ